MLLELLFGFGSPVDDVTDAEASTGPATDGAVAVMVMVLLVPTTDVCESATQAMFAPEGVQVQPEPVAVRATAPAPMFTLICTPVAEVGPLLRNVTVKLRLDPATTGSGVGTIETISRSERAARITVADPVAVQPELVAVTLNDTVVPVPALKVMAFVPCPPVMLPPVIDQL